MISFKFDEKERKEGIFPRFEMKKRENLPAAVVVHLLVQMGLLIGRR